jgi:transcriptional regulator with XRE-family HTH domain
MLGQNLRFLRLKHGFSQNYIASYLGKKSFTTVQKWETGVADPPLGIVGKLAELYEVSIDDLYYRDLSLPAITKSHIELTEHEEQLVKKYRLLSPAGKATVDAVIDVQYSAICGPPDTS